jgi:DivIVA domain-containing protein
MSNTSDLDLPLMPSAEQIRRREFASVRRGYDPDQVRDYLGAVATQVETLEGNLREARLTADTPPPPPTPASEVRGRQTDPYDELGKRVSVLIAAVDQESIRLVDDAKADSSRILQEARAEADRIRTDAQGLAEKDRQQGAEALAAAQAKADALLAGLSDRREAMVTQMQSMQTRLLNVAKELDVTIDDGGAGAAASVSATPPPAQGRTDTAAVAEGDDLADLVDPRYEDLWVSPDAGADAEAGAEVDAEDMPDLTSIEIDFESDDD